MKSIIEFSKDELIEYVSALNGEVARLSSLLREYQDGGVKTREEYDVLHDDYMKLISKYFDIKHKFEKMELWHGDYFSSFSKSIGNIVSGKPANAITNDNAGLITIQIDKSIIPKKKFKPSDLSFKELEECVNYFVENQHTLKNKPK